MEQGEGRNAADLVLLREHLLRFGVDLGEAHAGRELIGSLGEYGRELLAWAAPRRPEIHHHRQLIVLNELGKIKLGQIDRRAGQNQRIALAALGLRDQLFIGHAIDGETMRADEMHILGVGRQASEKTGFFMLDKWSRSLKFQPHPDA